MTVPYFRFPFASSGDTAAVPETVQPDGSVSYPQGYGPNYTANPATDPTALDIERTKMNMLFNAITSVLQSYQQKSFPNFITSADNGGTPYSYAAYAVVMYGGVAYQSLVSSNTDTPPSSKWSAIPLGLIGASSIRTKLTGNVSYYVATTGSDTTGNGSSLTPWATMQFAANYIQNNLDLNGYSVTVNVANGAYTAGVLISGGFVDSRRYTSISGASTGGVRFVGNTAAPGSCTVSVSSAGTSCFSAVDGATFSIAGFDCSSSGAAYDAVTASNGAKISIVGNMTYGSCVRSHISALGSGSIVEISSGYTIRGGSTNHLFLSLGASEVIVPNAIPVTLTSTPNFSNQYASVSDNACLFTGNNITFSGVATGSKFVAYHGGVIFTNGSGVSYFPGSIAGTVVDSASIYA